MNKSSQISCFVKDNLISTIFFLNSSFIILFFNLLNKEKAEILYPLSISIFLYLIFILIEWFKYTGFIASLNDIIKNPYYNISTRIQQQKLTLYAIKGLHENYMRELKITKSDIKKEREFISQWIHNIKGNLNVIDLIAEKSASPIKSQTQKIYSSLNNILTMFRLNEFSKDYIPTESNLAQSLKKIISQKSDEFIYNNVYPKLQLHSEDIWMLSDEKWNEFLIGQIISNAIKYSKSPKETKYIYFITKEIKNKIYLTIKDEGIGIPAWDLNRVFDAFFTGENGRKCKNSTGIGLYLCHTICENLGHTISITSEISKGTEVTISYLAKMKD